VVHSSWTNQNDVLGAPNDTGTFSSTAGTMTVAFTGGFAALADDAKIMSVVIGIRLRGATAVSANIQTQLNVGDTSVITHTTGSSTVFIDRESVRDINLYSVAMLKGTLTTVLARGGTATTLYVDAVWIRITYSDAPTAEAKSWANSVVTTGSWTNPTYALGPSDDVSATRASTSAIVLGLAPMTDLPADAELVQVIMGTRFGHSAVNTYNAKLNLGDAVNRTVRPAAYNTNPKDYEWQLNPSLFTPELLRGTTLQLTFSQTAGTLSTNYLDSVWLRASYALPAAAASRAKRWTGSAWADAPVQRWSGSAYVPATVKRWDGSAWV
jgi:hypothetical protein